MRRLFITGTDTDCGKTYATCRLLDYFKEQGKAALAIKPVASGCQEIAGRLINADVEQLIHHNPNNKYIINPWIFKPPVSPHLASNDLTAKDIAEFCLSESFPNLDYLLIEGAGGLMVPLNGEETWIDFLRLSNIPVIIVVGMKLGCLNHALMTAEILSYYGIKCTGWIANCLDPSMLMLEENIATLNQRIKWPMLAKIPFKAQIQPISFLID